MKKSRRTKAATKKKRNRQKFLYKEFEDCHQEVDRISELSDEILVSIISLLTVREATATSILSARWRRLYTYIDRLRFPPLGSRNNFEKNLEESKEKEFPNYLDSINHILDSYKGREFLKEFSVQMPALEGVDIRRWLDFALTRKEVEIIDIHMVYYLNTYLDKVDSKNIRVHYTFPLSNMLISRKNNIGGLPGLKSLKELSLSAVNVDDRDVELLLSSFEVLECLSIECSSSLVNLSIFGRSVLKLKHLDIYYCWNVKSIEVHDMINLISLRCYKLPYKYVLQLNNVPKLIKFSTHDQCSDDQVVEILPRISPSIHDQLLHLKLWTEPRFIMAKEWTYKCTKLVKLKHLELEIDMDAFTDIHGVATLIEGFPLLEKLEIEFLWYPSETRKFKCRETVEWVFPLSNHLKKVTLSGYLGCPSELEFAMYIMKKAVALEELIIEPCDLTRKIRRRATARAWQYLRPATPKTVNFVII